MCASAAGLDLQERLYFTQNVALVSGGGMSLHLVRNVAIKCVLFKENIAYSGGGLKISNCENVLLGNNFPCETSFEGNAAVEGGAVHMEPGNYQQSTYKVLSRHEPEFD